MSKTVPIPPQLGDKIRAAVKTARIAARILERFPNASPTSWLLKTTMCHSELLATLVDACEKMEPAEAAALIKSIEKELKVVHNISNKLYKGLEKK